MSKASSVSTIDLQSAGQIGAILCNYGSEEEARRFDIGHERFSYRLVDNGDNEGIQNARLEVGATEVGELWFDGDANEPPVVLAKAFCEAGPTILRLLDRIRAEGARVKEFESLLKEITSWVSPDAPIIADMQGRIIKLGLYWKEGVKFPGDEGYKGNIGREDA